MLTKPLYFSSDNIVSDIVIQFPKASDYFRDHKIDFCCGGKRPLMEAVEEKGLDIDQVLEELRNLAANHAGLNEGNEDANHFIEMSSQELIHYIVSIHHDYLREELPAIYKNVTRVNRVHGDHDQAQLYVLFTQLKDELLEHTSNEEEQIFPKMVALDQSLEGSINQELYNSIGTLEEEHDKAGNILKEIREITNDFTPPINACTTYRLTYERLAELERMTYEHVHLENNILFPRYYK